MTASACPLRSRLYGGIPSGGGYKPHTEYEIGALTIAEATHCILGSLGKWGHGVSWEHVLSVEKQHIFEERDIIVEAQREYSRDVYERQLETYLSRPGDQWGRESVLAIQRNSPLLKATSEDALDELRQGYSSYDGRVYAMAEACYKLLIALATAMQDSVDAAILRKKLRFNALGSRSVESHVRALSQAVDAAYR